MDKPENTSGRLQTLELSLNEAKDDVADTRSTQGLGGQTISGGGFIRPVAWDFPKGAAADIDPFAAAWSVRIYAVKEKDEATQEEKVVHKREIFSPLWRTKDATHVAEGCAEGAWKDLPGDVATGNGTLYAVLKITVAATTYEQTGWELRLATDVSSLSDTPIVPPDPNGTGGGEGTDGIYHLIVPIGRFSGSADDAGATGFEQWHVGVIAEDFLPRRTFVERTVVESIGVEGNKLQIYRKTVRTVLPDGTTPEREEVPLPEGGGGEGLPGGTLVAWDVVEKTYSGSGADEQHPDGSIWLRQRWRVWNAEQKAFVSSAEHPDTDICRLDTLVGGEGGGWCVGAPKIVNEGGSLYEVRYWWKVTAPTADNQPPTYVETTFEASRTALLAHGSDHTEGVL